MSARACARAHTHPHPSLLSSLTLAGGGKFHRPKLAKCLLSVWPACILKHLKSESSAHLQELQTEGVLCGKNFFNYEEFKKTSKLKLQTADLYGLLSAKSLKRDCTSSFEFCEDFRTWLAVYQPIGSLVLPHPVKYPCGEPNPGIPPLFNLQQCLCGRKHDFHRGPPS